MKLVFKERSKSAEAWAADVEAWMKSGLSKAAFCREHGLDYARFFYWASRQAENRISRLVPVPLVEFDQENSSRKASPSAQLGCLTIRVGHFSLEVGSDVDEQRLELVLRAMKAVG